jgi:hypothetical protein
VSKNYILLKFGTLKGWNLDNEKALAHLERYAAIGMSMSVMAQQDTDEQKEILCELIRCHDGDIKNDWDGKHYTKDEAIEYIQNYGKKK